MYNIVNGTLVMSVNDWCEAGLSYEQFKNDSKRGYLTIFRRGTKGNTLIDVRSISRSDRRNAIEDAYGKIEADTAKTGFKAVLPDQAAASFYASYRDSDGKALTSERRNLYTNSALLMNTLVRIHQAQLAARARGGERKKMKDWWRECVEFVKENSGRYPNLLPTNARRFEEKYKAYVRDGYAALVKKTNCRGNAEKLTERAKDWLVARWASPIDRCTITQLHILYNEEAATRGWQPVNSSSTIERFLNQPEILPMWYGARYGELKAKEKYTRQHRTILPHQRDALWYGDGTKLNYYYRNENGKVATCSVYEVVDVFSETLLGYYISDSENYEAQYHAFKMAMEFAGHKPYEVRFDNQGGHKKLESSSLFAKMAHLSISCQPYNGKSKTIESIFGRFQQSYLHKDWYFTGQNITAKKRESRANMEFIAANAKNLPTLEEVKKQYAARREEWNSAKHPETGVSRIEMYKQSHNEKTTEVGVFDMISIFGLMNPKPVKYRANGLVMQVSGVKYQYEVIDSKGQPDFAFLKANVDREFFVEYMPDDMSVVALYEETSTGERRFVTMADKYIAVHRAIQDQDDFDHAFIKAMDSRNKQMRIEMAAETEDILERNGLHPSKHGLVMPKPKGNFRRNDEDVEPGRVMKRESNVMLAVDDEGGSIYDLY